MAEIQPHGRSDARVSVGLDRGPGVDWPRNLRLIGGAKTFNEAAPAIAEQTNNAFEQIEAAYRERVPASIQEQLDPRLEEYRDSISDSLVSMVENIAGLVQSNISQVITLIATPIAIFQILYQPKALTDALRRLVPGPLLEDLPEMGRIVGVTVIAYIRVQLLGAIFVGGTIWLLYWAVGNQIGVAGCGCAASPNSCPSSAPSSSCW